MLEGAVGLDSTVKFTVNDDADSNANMNAANTIRPGVGSTALGWWKRSTGWEWECGRQQILDYDIDGSEGKFACWRAAT